MLEVLEKIGACVRLLKNTLRELPSIRHQIPRLLEQAYQIGCATVPIAAVMNLCIGAVLAIQIGYVFNFSGGQEVIGSVCGFAIAREIGPLLTAFVLAGRIASATTAEIASMTIYQEIDALRTMDIPPARILVLPRLIAVLLTMPFLTLISVTIGFWGGAVACDYIDFISITSDQYWSNLKANVTPADITNGLIKAEIFGFTTLLIACNEGLKVSGGPREIGLATTRSVVIAMFTTLLLDYVFTRILL